MRIRIPVPAALLALALALPLAAQQQADINPQPIPAGHPAARRAAAVVEPILAGDRAAALEVLRREGDPAFVNGPMEQFVDRVMARLAPAGKWRITGFAEAGIDGDVIVALASGEERNNVAVRMQAQPPHRITGFARAGNGDGMSPGTVSTTPPPAGTPLTAAAQQAVVDSVGKLLEAMHTAPDTGQMIASRLRERHAAGAYTALTVPADFAAALTRDMQSVNGDRHLRVTTGAPATRGPAAMEAGQRNNFGFERVEMLPGNVGYIDISGPLMDMPAALQAATGAIRQVEGADAVILDLRGVPGGSGQMANFLISHFTAPDLPSLNVYRRQTGRTELRSTLAEVPGPRRTEVPLYVLIDRGAASAAEDIPFVLQNLGRATLVGERTAGAGRNNGFFPVGYGMGVSVSVSRVTDPASGREWETVGVQPDIAASSQGALAAAHQAALRRLAEAAADETRRATLLATAEYIGAQASPIPVDAGRLAQYAGRYSNGRIVTAEGGRLYFQPSEDAPRRELIPLADGRFAAGPALRAEFAPGEGGRLQLRLGAPGETPRVFDRLP